MCTNCCSPATFFICNLRMWDTAVTRELLNINTSNEQLKINHTWTALIMPTCAAPLAPPPPKTSPTDVPVSHLAKREKSEWIFGSDLSTFVYSSFCVWKIMSNTSKYIKKIHKYNSNTYTHTNFRHGMRSENRQTSNVQKIRTNLLILIESFKPWEVLTGNLSAVLLLNTDGNR